MGISQRKDGQMKMVDFDVCENRDQFLQTVGLSVEDVVSSGLVHGSHVARVSRSDMGTLISDTDALVTNDKGVILAVTVADCVPVYFYDSVKNVIGIAHAGWRGVVSEIVKKTIGTMGTEYESDPKDIKALIGPHINACHFEIGEDIVQNFEQYPKAIKRAEGKIFVDLSLILEDQLLSIGMAKEYIIQSNECTYCNPEKYFSYRRDKPEKVEAMLCYIVM